MQIYAEHYFLNSSEALVENTHFFVKRRERTPPRNFAEGTQNIRASQCRRHGFSMGEGGRGHGLKNLPTYPQYCVFPRFVC